MQNDAEITAAVKRINEGKATYKEVEDLAYRVGVDLSKALKGHITNEIMPEGHVPQNVAEKILQPTLREAHELVIEAATKTQEAMNKAAGIGLKALAAEFDEEKAQGFVHKLTNGLLDETGWILDAPVTSFVQSSADRTLKKNVKFQARAGLKPRITREAEGGCCPWCSKLEGSYDYGDEPDDIYRRHRRCRCVVDYRPGDGRRQNVWSKAWHEDAEPEKVEERKKRTERKKGIEKKAIDDRIEAERGNRGRKFLIKETTVDLPFIRSPEYRRRIDKLTESADESRGIHKAIKEILKHRSGTLFEDLSFIDMVSGNILTNKDYDFYDEKEGTSACIPSKAMLKMLKNAKEKSIIAVHNHPGSTPPSLDDIQRAFERKYKYGIVVCNNSAIYKYRINKNFSLDDFHLFNLKIGLDDLGCAIKSGKNEDISKAIAFLKNHGVDLEYVL